MVNKGQFSKDLTPHSANAGSRGSDLTLLTGLALLHNVVIFRVYVGRNPKCRSPTLELLSAHVIVLEVQLVQLNVMFKLSMDSLQDKRKTSLNLRVLLVSDLRQSVLHQERPAAVLPWIHWPAQEGQRTSLG